MDNLTFGQFITQQRKERDISLRRFAVMIDISPEYLCNIEKHRRAAPASEVLERIARVLLLDKYEAGLMYDLAADSKNTLTVLPDDLTGFLNENRVVVAALRMAKDVDATDAEWQEFMQKLRAKKDNNVRGDS